MASPCNTLNTQTIKLSQLPAYSYLTSSDFILVVQSSSGGNLYSRRSTLGNLLTYIQENGEGAFTGSFSGNITGNITGTSSWASNATTTVSASYALSSSKAYTSTYASISTSALASNTAALANTASFLSRKTKHGNKSLAMWDGTTLGQSTITTAQYSYPSTTYYDISASYNQSVPNKQGVRIFAGSTSDFWLINTSRLGAGYNTHPNMDAVYMDAANYGAFGLKTFTGSFHMSYATPTVSGAGAGGPRSATVGNYNGILPMMQQVRNNIYFWPQPGIYSTSRDGGVGIGVSYTSNVNPTGSFSQYLRAKLQVDMFSGSTEGTWANGGNPQVEHRAVAILVRQVSGSIIPQQTFFVSASGDMYNMGSHTTGKPITCSFAEEASAGSDSGLYMPVMVDGVKYKVKLYDWS